MRNSEEIQALIRLLDDPDRNVTGTVIDRLIEIGSPAVNMLEKSWEHSTSEMFQERIENVIVKIQQGVIRRSLKDWSDCRGDQILYGAYLVAKTQYPELKYESLDAKLDQLKTEIWLELNDHLTALEKVRVINHFLFARHKFSRSVRGVLSPQLFFVNHVLDTHKGLPISLSIIYAEIASRLELPIYGVDLPHNFLLCYHDPTYLDDPDGIMFYINPYSKGAILGRTEVEIFLAEQKLEANPEYLRPCSNIETIKRLIEGLRFAYSASRMEEKAAFLDELLVILKRGMDFQIP